MPPTCEIRDWSVFGPGYHKGDLYSPATNRHIGEIFARLSVGRNGNKPYLVPAVKLGHDTKQRLAESLGFLTLGVVSGCEVDPDGTVRLTLTGVPTEIGSQVNAGFLNGGSVELSNKPIDDPDNPAAMIAPPVLTGVALLGEEQPAVKGMPPPRAVFADGTEVPPATSIAPWLEKMAEVAMSAARFSADDFEDTVLVGGRRVAVCRIKFSEVMPVNREQLNAKLTEAGLDPANYADLSDEQVQKLLDGMGGEQFAAAMKKKFAEPAPIPDPKAKPGDKMGDGLGTGTAATPGAPDPAMMAAVKSCMAEVMQPFEKRMGDLEKATTDIQAAKPKLEAAAAFSDTFAAREKAAKEGRVRDAINARPRKILPIDRDRFFAEGMAKSDTVTMSDGPSKGKTEFDAWLAELDRRPDFVGFTESIAATKDGLKPGERVLSPEMQALLNTGAVKHQNPQLRENLLKHAKA